MTSTIKVDTISENTSANGVAVDGVTLKDGAVGATGTATSVAGIPFFSDTSNGSIYTHDVSGTDSTAEGNVAYGLQALDAITTGDYNTAIGYQALSAQSEGEGNVAVGQAALLANTTAGNNLAVGKASLLANTTGTRNVAIGNRTNDQADTENDNLAIGYQAMTGAVAGGEYNVAIGNYSLDALTSADKCVAIGYEAGSAITTGGGNTLVGNEAGKAITTGTFNTFFGFEAGDNFDAEEHNTGIGPSALGGPIAGGEYNVAMGGNSLVALTTGDANTTVGYNSGLQITTGYENVAVGTGAAYGLTTGYNNVALGVNAGYNMSTGDNNILIGKDAGRTGSPGGQIDTENNIICIGDENITNFHCQVDVEAASDKRDKTDVSSIDIGLEFINKLEPVTYRWDKRSKYDNEVPTGEHKEAKLDIGFLAQDVEVLENEYGYKKEDETNLTTNLSKDGQQYGIKYSKFVPILVKAVQELSATVATLQQEIKILKEGL